MAKSVVVREPSEVEMAELMKGRQPHERGAVLRAWHRARGTNRAARKPQAKS